MGKEPPWGAPVRRAANPGCLRHRIHVEIPMGKALTGAPWPARCCRCWPPQAARRRRAMATVMTTIAMAVATASASYAANRSRTAAMNAAGRPCPDDPSVVRLAVRGRRDLGQSRYGVWVTQGCRAEFVGEYRRGGGWGGGHGNGWGNGGNGWGGGEVITCHSNGHRRNTAMPASAVACARSAGFTQCLHRRPDLGLGPPWHLGQRRLPGAVPVN